MPHSLLRVLAPALVTLALAAPASAQTRVMTDLVADVTEAEGKIMQLARAMPEAALGWRPAPGVRSTQEVLAHIASDNYFLPALGGAEAPADTGILGSDHKTTAAYEKRARTSAQTIAELEQSFAFLKKAMRAQAEAGLEARAQHSLERKMTNLQLWIATTTHLREHLGQLIAYARSNKVAPPWSK